MSDVGYINLGVWDFVKAVDTGRTARVNATTESTAAATTEGEVSEASKGVFLPTRNSIVGENASTELRNPMTTGFNFERSAKMNADGDTVPALGLTSVGRPGQWTSKGDTTCWTTDAGHDEVVFTPKTVYTTTTHGSKNRRIHVRGNMSALPSASLNFLNDKTKYLNATYPA